MTYTVSSGTLNSSILYHTSWQQKSHPADELLQLACLLKSLFLQLLDRVKEQATFWQCSTTCCTCLCQPCSHASGYLLWTWLAQNSQTVSFLVYHGSAGIITSVMNILIFQVISHTFHDFSIPKVIFHDCPDLKIFYFKSMTFQTFPGSVQTLALWEA